MRREYQDKYITRYQDPFTCYLDTLATETTPDDVFAIGDIIIMNRLGKHVLYYFMDGFVERDKLTKRTTEAFEAHVRKNYVLGSISQP